MSRLPCVSMCLGPLETTWNLVPSPNQGTVSDFYEEKQTLSLPLTIFIISKNLTLWFKKNAVLFLSLETFVA